MQFKIASAKIQDVKADSLLVFVPHYSAIKLPLLKHLDAATRGAVTDLMSSEEFSGKAGEVVCLLKPAGLHVDRVFLLGIGETKKVAADTFRQVMGIASRHRGLAASRKAALYFDGYASEEYYQAAVEGYLLGSFRMLEYKSGKDREDPSKLAEICVVVANRSALKKAESGVRRGEIIAEGQNMVRRLAAMPSNDLTPSVYAKTMQDLAKKHRLECRVLDEQAIAKEKMNLVQAVAKGSKEAPKFVILKYRGAAAAVKPIVLVGKGVTFDSGGISLKPAADMHEMKGDMTGSAVVVATMVTAARLKLRQNLIALMPLVENMPSGHAQKPGDVITSRKGLTVEIINTDAEGRLILADALDYANTFKPQAVIDIATLTGAALYVLGYAGAPILGNRKSLMDQLRAASRASSELVWEMPIWDEHREAMRSSFADLTNSGGRAAGTITASAFLERFIGDWPWAHIDIAYVDVEPKGRPYIPKGSTGIGLRLLVELLSRWKRP